MPLQHYGVLKAPLIDRQLATDKSDHYQLLCLVGSDRWRVAINARSAVAPSEVAYAVISPFAHPLTARVDALPDGYTALPGATAAAGGLDYVRGNLAQQSQFRPLPISAPGANNDLNDLFEFHLRPLIGDSTARVFAFGDTWGPEPKADQYFNFKPGRGIHDIHQNQGNVGKYAADDGVFQDGGLLVHRGGVWTAILLRFQSQAWHTDDHTGHTVADVPTPAADLAVRIVAASVNPPGGAPEHETVILLNTTYKAIDLQGWKLVTDAGAAPLSGSLPAASPRTIDMPVTAPLSNKGGHITLLDAGGLKRHGVAYTAAQAAGEQGIVVF
jgi:uncharacterized protein YukJ